MELLREVALLPEVEVDAVKRRAASRGHDVADAVAQRGVERVLMSADRGAELQLHEQRVDLRPELLGLGDAAGLDQEGRVMEDGDLVLRGRGRGRLLEP